MSKVWAFILCLLTVVACLMMTVQPVYAAESNEFFTWSQKDSRWKDDFFWHNPEKNVDWTIGNAGCNFVSTCILLACADPSLRDPNKFTPKIANPAKGATTYFANTDSVLTDKAPIKELSSVKIADTSLEGNMGQINDKIKSLLAEGKYVIVCANATSVTGMHFVPVLGMASDGYPIVWDVAMSLDSYPKNYDDSGTLAHPSGGQTKSILGKIRYLRVFEAKDGYQKSTESLKDLPPNFAANATDAIIAAGGLVNEWDLAGMPLPPFLQENSVSLTLPDGSNLTQKEQNTIGIIKDNMNADQTSAYEVLHTVFTVVGLILIVYAILLVLAFIFDRVNVFFDFSVVGFLSFGKIRVLTGTDYGDVIPEGYISHKLFFVRVGLIFVIGALLVSGVIPRLVERVVGSFM